MMRSRRMWARRILRAGWLLAPILAAPGRVLRFFFGTCGSTVKTLVVTAFLASVTSCNVNWYNGTRPATPEQMTEYLKDNWCMQELMPTRAALDYQNRAITLSELKAGKTDCEDAAEKWDAFAKQKAVLEKLGVKK